MSNDSRARGDFANPSRFRPRNFSLDCDANTYAKADAQTNCDAHANAQTNSQAHSDAKAEKVRGLSQPAQSSHDQDSV